MDSFFRLSQWCSPLINKKLRQFAYEYSMLDLQLLCLVNYQKIYNDD